jgi:hypothetical protein
LAAPPNQRPGNLPNRFAEIPQLKTGPRPECYGFNASAVV